MENEQYECVARSSSFCFLFILIVYKEMSCSTEENITKMEMWCLWFYNGSNLFCNLSGIGSTMLLKSKRLYCLNGKNVRLQNWFCILMWTAKCVPHRLHVEFFATGRVVLFENESNNADRIICEERMKQRRLVIFFGHSLPFIWSKAAELFLGKKLGISSSSFQ